MLTPHPLSRIFYSLLHEDEPGEVDVGILPGVLALSHGEALGLVFILAALPFEAL